jgi:mono/diheme cytochrome c family protein
MTSCIECHGLDLRGGDGTPSLAGAYGYSPEEFVRLARTGTPREARPLTLMADIARDRLAHMSDNELADLHAYLRTIPPQGSPVAAR